MPVRRIYRSAAGIQNTPNGGPDWNSIRVDATTGQVMVGTGTSGNSEIPVLGNISVVASPAATYTILASQSGSTFLFDRAGGIVYTLPVPVVGLTYSFVTTVSLTSGEYEVATDAGTTFFVGGVLTGIDTSATTVFSAANGTSHISISMNDTTTGGLKGTNFNVTCVAPTLWLIEGFVAGSGTVATPFDTTL